MERKYIITPVTDPEERETAVESIGFDIFSHVNANYFKLALLPEHKNFVEGNNTAYFCQLPDFHNEFFSVFGNEDFYDADLLKVADWVSERIPF